MDRGAWQAACPQLRLHEGQAEATIHGASEEAVPGPSVFPSGEPGVSGDSWGSQEGCQGPFRPSGRNRGLPLSP